MLLIIVIVLLALLALFLFYQSSKVNKSIDVLLDNGKIKDLRNVLFAQIDKTKALEELLGKTQERTAILENLSKISFHKLGVVRFNPFNNLGGNQSFVIALLDGQNNGFVISSLFIKEGNRVYTKAVINGISEHSLSDEEKEAIKKAINTK